VTRDIHANGPGIGDAMCLSIIVEELGKRGEKSNVYSCFPELYENNPYVEKALPWTGQRSFPELDDMRVCGNWSMYRHMLRRFGIDNVEVKELRQYIYFGKDETQATRFNRYITISPIAGRWTRNKDWQLNQWEKLVQLLGMEVIQLGGNWESPIVGTNQDYRCVSLRVSARLIRYAVAHICVVTGTMHIAAATSTPTFVIFGGREDWKVTGYPQHIKFSTTPLPCSPCWLVEECPHKTNGEKECMRHIDAESVFETIRERIK
jgi:ADP-heptose:LPS heptosyltransferase